MLLRQRIENILINSYMAIGIKEFRQDILDEIMNEINKEVNKPISFKEESHWE